MKTLGRPRILSSALLALAMLSFAAFFSAPAAAAEEQKPPVRWEEGPVLAQLGDVAEIQVPEGFAFTNKEGTKKLLELTHNLVAGNELGALIPSRDSTASWFVIFQFNGIGFVKDDDKDKIDAEALLKSLREGTEQANKERRKKGWDTYTVAGWEVPPYYDSNTHNLTWAIRGNSSSGTTSVNHSLRILGRRGTMDVDLVLDPAQYITARAQFDSVMAGFRFKQGHQYADFVKGDKVAAIGLSALVLGGAGALAVKTGLLASSWKLLLGLVLALKKVLILVVIAMGAALKRLWGHIRGLFAPKDEVPGLPPDGGGTGP